MKPNTFCSQCGLPIYRRPYQVRNHPNPLCNPCWRRNPRIKYTHELLAPIVAASNTFSEVARKLQLRPHGGTNNHLKLRIAKLRLDISHFRYPKPSCNNGLRLSPIEILILRPEGSRRQSVRILRRALLEIGRPHKCAQCGQPPFWNGKSLTLQVEHKNGKIYDDRKENLDFLCPNCHSQTETYGAKNQGKAAPYFLPDAKRPQLVETAECLAHRGHRS